VLFSLPKKSFKHLFRQAQEYSCCTSGRIEKDGTLHVMEPMFGSKTWEGPDNIVVINMTLRPLATEILDQVLNLGPKLIEKEIPADLAQHYSFLAENYKHPSRFENLSEDELDFLEPVSFSSLAFCSFFRTRSCRMEITMRANDESKTQELLHKAGEVYNRITRGDLGQPQRSRWQKFVDLVKA